LLYLEEGFQEIYQGIILIDKKGCIKACNKSAYKLLAQELLEESIEKIFSNATPINNVLSTGAACKNKIYKIGNKKIVYNVNPIFSEDEIIGAIVSFQDIIDFELINKEMEYGNEFINTFEAIFNSFYDEIYITDGEGKTIWVNDSCEKFYGMKAEEITGKYVSELEQQGVFAPSITPQVLKTKKTAVSIQNTKTGKKLIVIANPVIDDNGNIVKVITKSHDITEISNLHKRLAEAEQLKEVYRTEIAKLRKKGLEEAKVIHSSTIMENLMQRVERVARVDSTVFIHGESGVGKGVIAFKIHQLSNRSNNPIVTINCGSIPENLVESELFGYEEGAFTGAKKRGKKGLLEIAHKGTIFFDEITEIPLNIQVKLLSIIQDKKIIRLGGSSYIDIDIRIIAATNRNIQSLIRENKFREDLFYRLNVVPIVIPPLRQRKEDIPSLIDFFLDKFGEKYGIHREMSSAAKAYLLEYNWPGNVRELENLIERLLVTIDSVEITPDHLPEYIVNTKSSSEKVHVLDICLLKNATEEVERQLLKKAFAKFKNTYLMAETLGVNQSTIVRKMRKYDIK
jgi:PAS domain S-box-containing protein